VPPSNIVAATIHAAEPFEDSSDDTRPAIVKVGTGKSRATRLVDLALASGVELWHSPAGDPYATLPVDGHREHHRLKAAAVRDWLARRHHSETGEVLSAQAINDAMAVLSGMARFDGMELATAVRVGGGSDAVYLDLGGPTWNAVEITPSGWRMVVDPPVRFVRSVGMLALPEPARGGAIDELRPLLHVASDDDFRLLVGWVLGALRPAGPYPMLSLVGEQGSGKSTVARLVRRMIDPHKAELRAEPRSVDDLMVAAARSRIIALDNLSHVPSWLSDALCRVATGGALTKREHYSNDDEVIIEAVRPRHQQIDRVVLHALVDRVAGGLESAALHPQAAHPGHRLEAPHATLDRQPEMACHSQLEIVVVFGLHGGT